RPVKIDNSLKCYAQAAEPNMLFNAEMHRSIREVTDTITHELIHYELSDAGKFSGHAKEFQKRAEQLGILRRIELDQCLLNNIECRPHTSQLKEIPLSEFVKEIDDRLEQLKRLATRAPIEMRAKLYTEVTAVEVMWQSYRMAVETGKDHV